MGEDDVDINYAKCCFFNENVCGEWKRLRRKGIFSLHQLNYYVHSLPGIKQKELILSRAPKCEFTDESFFVLITDIVMELIGLLLTDVFILFMCNLLKEI